MTTVGFHVSHEQLSPRDGLRAVMAAEEAGFGAAICSDHLASWSQRCHTVIAAQAVANLGVLFPGRLWAALGSGEAVNEHVTGDRWPDEPARDARLLEVTHDGLVRVDQARLWDVPDQSPALFAAAVSPETAERAPAAGPMASSPSTSPRRTGATASTPAAPEAARCRPTSRS